VLFYSSPTPEKAKSKKRKQAPADDSKAVPQESAAALEAADAHGQVDTDDAFHAAAGSLFRDWLTQHKAQLAEEEQVSPYNPIPNITASQGHHLKSAAEQSAELQAGDATDRQRQTLRSMLQQQIYSQTVCLSTRRSWSRKRRHALKPFSYLAYCLS